jgi:hypothetical protein
MADNVPITPGSGISIATDDVSGVQYQRFKLDIGGDGVSKPVIQGGSDGLPVDVLSGPATGLVTKPLAGQAWPVTDNGTTLSVDDGAGSLTVDAPVGTPVFVRLSDGSSAITTLPVSGTVTANQGTAAAASGAWFAKITNGTDSVGITDVGGAKALKVDVIQSTVAAQPADSATFTATTTKVQPIAGVYDDAVAAPSSGQLAAIRLTANRGLHVSLRAAAGTEIGTSGAPVRVDPTDATKQSIKLFDNGGSAFTDANPLFTTDAISNRTRVTKSVSLTASQTGVTLWTPTGSTRFVITSIELNISVVGDLTVFDGTNSAANLVFNTLAAGLQIGRQSYNFTAHPWRSSTVDNVLKYTSGSGLVAIMTIHGFETT